MSGIYKIGLCGNIDLAPLAQRIDAIIPGVTIVVGMPEHFREEIGSPPEDLVSVDLVIVALDWRRIAPDIFRFGYNDNFVSAFDSFQRICDELHTLISHFRKSAGARILLFSPVSAWQSPLGFIERLQGESPARLFDQCQRIFDRLCQSVADVFPVDMDRIAGAVGKENAFDQTGGFTKSQPFSAEMIDAVSIHIAAIVTQFAKYPLKCIVVDLDNTVWGGVIGDDGYENILLGDDGIGAAYKEFQSEIVKLSKQGVMLAICSKNNTCDALEVIQKHPHMLIRPDMISCYRINWDDKPKNISEIAQELNIGFDSIMFIDDTPAEREQVRSAFPDIEILDLPPHPALYANSIRKCTRFWPVQLTVSDTRKSEFFGSNRKRQYVYDQIRHKEKFLHQSEINLIIGKSDPETMPRVCQLFNKTNQFNLTTKRYTQAELQLLSAADTNLLLWMSLRDKYGDYGVIATAIVLQDHIDSFIVSCRAFGKDVESVFLNTILNHLSIQGIDVAYGTYIASDKNSMVKDFYKSRGFTLHSSISPATTVWKCELNSTKREIPSWVTLESII